MQYALRDYQIDAVSQLLDGLADTIRAHKRRGKRSSLLLAAPTAAGKTVIAAGLIEAILLGRAGQYGVDDEGAFEGATILWLSQDPSLNRQTARRIAAASDVTEQQLVVVDQTTDQDEFDAGKVYFLNTDKLGRGASYSDSGTDRRQVSMWDTIAATSRRKSGPLLLLVDEAHLGVGNDKPSSSDATIMARLIADADGTAPVVLGITATPHRFERANKRPLAEKVVVPVDVVRESGVIKQKTLLADVGEAGTYGSTVLAIATKRLAEMDAAWQVYADASGIPHLHPLMVVQVQDSVTDAHLFELVSTMREVWPELGPDSFCHTLEDRNDRVLGPVTIHYTPPEAISGRTKLRVAITKKALTTGWDCPRAEVLYSERPAQDATLIAQTIGRLVRAPLVHAIDEPQLLNEAYAYLPSYHVETAEAVVAHLNGEPGQDPDGDDNVAREMGTFEPAEDMDEQRELLLSLPSLSTPARHIDPVRAAKAAAIDLDVHKIEPRAGAELDRRIIARLVGLQHELAGEIAKMRDDITHVELRTRSITPGQSGIAVAEERIVTSDADLERAWRAATKQVPQGIAYDFYRHVTDPMEHAGTEYDAVEVKVDLTALFRTEGVLDAIVTVARDWLSEKLDEHDVAIASAGEEARHDFDAYRAQSGRPEQTPILLPKQMRAVTVAAGGDVMPLTGGHLYVDADGQFPVPQGSSWEAAVLETEQGRSGFAGWYRNPPTGAASLTIPYEKAEGWTAVHPDFVVFSRTGDGELAASIVDPHDPSRGDAMPKLRALAAYAAERGNAFLRIESVVKVADEYRKLSMKDAAVRNAIAVAGDGQGAAAGLFSSTVSKTYK